jgi:hypothetical protein
LLLSQQETVQLRRKTLFILTQRFFLTPTTARPFLLGRHPDHDHTTLFHPCNSVYGGRNARGQSRLGVVLDTLGSTSPRNSGPDRGPRTLTSKLFEIGKFEAHNVFYLYHNILIFYP